MAGDNTLFKFDPPTRKFTEIGQLLNNGNGTFAAKIDYPTGPGPISVAAADLNGDGKPDLAVANFNSNTVSVLLNSCLP